MNKHISILKGYIEHLEYVKEYADEFFDREQADKDIEAFQVAIKALEKQPYDFARWVAREIFNDEWEYNKDAFAEIACRKLAKLGIVIRMGDEWELVEQEPCEDEYIKVPKKALKYRTEGMVAYNTEWLKNHFDIERAVICGAQDLCEDTDFLLWGEEDMEEMKKTKDFPSINLQEKYCNRNICLLNEYNGIGCDECEVTKSEDAINRKNIAAFLSGLISDDTERKKALQYVTELPPVNLQAKTGHWIHFAASDDCSECGWSTGKYISPSKYCPNCGIRMVESKESEGR